MNFEKVFAQRPRHAHLINPISVEQSMVYNAMMYKYQKRKYIAGKGKVPATLIHVQYDTHHISCSCLFRCLSLSLDCELF